MMFETIRSLTIQEIQHEILITLITGFVVWLLVKGVIKGSNYFLTLLAKVNKHIKIELLVHQRMHHAHCMHAANTVLFASLHTLSIYIAFNRFIYATVFICLGFITVDTLVLHHASFLIALIYLFLSLKALPLTFDSGVNRDDHKAEFEKLTLLIDSLQNEK